MIRRKKELSEVPCPAHGISTVHITSSFAVISYGSRAGIPTLCAYAEEGCERPMKDASRSSCEVVI